MVRKYSRSRAYDILILLAGVRDFAAEKSRAVIGSSTATVKAKEGEPYAIFLEDIHQSYVTKYLDFALYGVFQNHKNSVKELEKENKDTRTWFDSDNEVFSEADLLKTGDDRQLDEEIESLEKLPYLLKRLHNLGKQNGISIISMMIAASKTKRTAHNTIQPGIMLENGVYKLSSTGNIIGRVVKNEGRYRTMFDWFVGKDATDPYYLDMIEVQSICEQLGIEIEFEDPELYDEDFFSQLTISYIPSNKTYMQTELNKEVLRLMKGVKVSDIDCAPMTKMFYPKRLTNKELAEKKLLLFQYEGFVSEKDDDILEEVIDLYCQMTGEDINENDIVSYGGIIKLRQKEYLYFDVTQICKSIQIPYATAILHTLGYFILLDESNKLTVLNIRLAKRYMFDLVYDRIKPGQAYDTFKFGSWLHLE